jgi:uncharacterized protein
VRVFLDTNVLVAAFATRGLCSDVLRTVLAEHELLLSTTVIEKLRRTLIEKLRVPEPTVSEIAAYLRASATLAEMPSKPAPVAIRDPDDAVTLSEALSIGAEVLVTGDKDLLEAGTVPGITIIDPRGFWHLVRERSSRGFPLLALRPGLRGVPERGDAQRVPSSLRRRAAERGAGRTTVGR